MATTWEDYLTRPDAASAHRDCHLRFRRAFASQRDCIRRIFETTRPRVVACLGAGVLNDLPYRTFIESGAVVHLVDWLPGVVESGVAHSIIRHTESGPAQCVYCLCPEADARAYCRTTENPEHPPGRCVTGSRRTRANRRRVGHSARATFRSSTDKT